MHATFKIRIVGNNCILVLIQSDFKQYEDNLLDKNEMHNKEKYTSDKINNEGFDFFYLLIVILIQIFFAINIYIFFLIFKY